MAGLLDTCRRFSVFAIVPSQPQPVRTAATNPWPAVAAFSIPSAFGDPETARAGCGPVGFDEHPIGLISSEEASP
jgi:hypothetical protein